MTAIEALMSADKARRDAMINADKEALEQYFHEDLIWTHSSGQTDDRSGLTESICSGGVVYHSIENEDVSVSQHGEIFLLSGTLRGDVTKNGQPKQLANKFLSVWQDTGTGFRMLAWQSTGLPG